MKLEIYIILLYFVSLRKFNLIANIKIKGVQKLYLTVNFQLIHSKKGKEFENSKIT